MDYAKLNLKVRTLVKNYGTPLTLQQASYTTFSPTLGRYTSNTTSNYKVYGVIRSPSRRWSGDVLWGADTVIESGDREIVLATSASATPDADNTIIIAGVPYRIVACNPCEPGGTTLLFKILVRR